MYATLPSGPAVDAARALARARRSAVGPRAQVAGLLALLDQVAAEAAVHAPEAAALALVQAEGDVARAVTLVRVWAATLPDADVLPVAAADVRVVRRVSATFPSIPGGQWLGVAAGEEERLLDWPDEDDDRTDLSPPDPGPLEPRAPAKDGLPRVADLLSSVPVRHPAPEGDGPDPAARALRPPLSRPARLAVLARGETGALVALAGLSLAGRHEAVLSEIATGVAEVRVAHPRTGRPVRVAEVTLTEAEVVCDALVDGHPGFGLGWGATLGGLDRRAIAAAVLDGHLQGGAPPGRETWLDENAVLAAVDGPATSGFVEHLRLPHHASFAAYLRRVETTDEEDSP